MTAPASVGSEADISLRREWRWRPENMIVLTIKLDRRAMGAVQVTTHGSRMPNAVMTIAFKTQLMWRPATKYIAQQKMQNSKIMSKAHITFHRVAYMLLTLSLTGLVCLRTRFVHWLAMSLHG